MGNAATTGRMLGLLFLLFGAVPAWAQSSSEKVRANPAAQYVLIKSVIGQAIGTVDARATSVDPEGYDLLKYCWTPSYVLGDWVERAGLTGEMIVHALETHSWARDLGRAGYPAAAVGEAIGRYEAALIAAGFTGAARERALDALVVELENIRRTAAGAAKIRRVGGCDGPSPVVALNHVTQPDDGRARFIPHPLYQVCRAQQLDADDPVRCDYWLAGKPGEPINFVGEIV